MDKSCYTNPATSSSSAEVTRFRQTYDGACPPERPSGGAADATTSGGASLGGEGAHMLGMFTVHNHGFVGLLDRISSMVHK